MRSVAASAGSKGIILLFLMSILPVPLNVLGEHQVVLERPPSRAPPPLPVANATVSLWLANPGVLPSPTEGSEGELISDADLCIIGSGITGVSAAYHLAQTFATGEHNLKDNRAPLKVAILEAREFCKRIIICDDLLSDVLLCRFWCNRCIDFLLSTLVSPLTIWQVETGVTSWPSTPVSLT